MLLNFNIVVTYEEYPQDHSEDHCAHLRPLTVWGLCEWSYDATAAVLKEDQRAEVEDKSHTW